MMCQINVGAKVQMNTNDLYNGHKGCVVATKQLGDDILYVVELDFPIYGKYVVQHQGSFSRPELNLI